MFDDLRRRGFEIEYSSHAKAILEQDFPDIIVELERALSSVSLPITDIIGSGGGEAQLTQRLRRGFHDLGWQKRNIEMKKIVDGVEKESISHEIDHYHGTPEGNFALEIEWNNKDPFFDRDLESFKRLHAEGVIGIGAVITRGSALPKMLRDLIAGWAHREGLRDFSDLKSRGLKRPTERQEAIVEGKMARGASFEDAWASMFSTINMDRLLRTGRN